MNKLDIRIGKTPSILPWLRFSLDYEFHSVEFIDKISGETKGVFYVWGTDQNGFCNTIGSSLLGDYIGKGHGVEFFFRSVQKLSEEKSVKGVIIHNLRLNKFSRRLMEKLKADSRFEVIYEEPNFKISIVK